ncbi:MAG: hypothetical protein QX199_15685 [Methylococcaceae bacterium]
MKAKISHIIILSLVSSVLYGRYLLTPEQEAQPVKPSAAKVIAQAYKKPQPAITQAMNWDYAESAVEHAPIDETSLYAQLNDMLTALKTDQGIQLFDLTDVAHCSSCLALLQNYLLTGNLTNKQLAQLANSLNRGNHSELAVMLAETVAKMMHQSSDSKRNALLINALAKFNSAQVAKAFSSYLLSDNKMPLLLRDALINNINETTNRSQVAADLVKQFNDTDNAAVHEKLLAINHPEALAQISAQALEQNNTELYNQANEQLKSNPSKYALDALLAMPQMQSANTDQVNQVVESAYQLANRQFSGNRLDYIEEKLALNAYSEQDKSLVLDILTHSEDPVRSAEIIAKFSN